MDELAFLFSFALLIRPLFAVDASTSLVVYLTTKAALRGVQYLKLNCWRCCSPAKFRVHTAAQKGLCRCLNWNQPQSLSVLLAAAAVGKHYLENKLVHQLICIETGQLGAGINSASSSSSAAKRARKLILVSRNREKN